MFAPAANLAPKRDGQSIHGGEMETFGMIIPDQHEKGGEYGMKIHTTAKKGRRWGLAIHRTRGNGEDGD